jgi:hypothetical protein
VGSSFDFEDLTPLEETFKFRGRTYVLREPSEDAACRFKNASFRVSSFIHGKSPDVKDPADICPVLVSLCLFEKVEGKDGAESEKPVSLPVVKGWPSRMVRPMFEKLKEWGRLLDEDETAEDLEKRIAKDQKRLQELREEAERGGREKNSLGGTETT